MTAGSVALVIDGLYVWVLESEGEGDLHESVPRVFAAWIAVAGVLALAGATPLRPSIRFAALTSAAFSLLAVGFVGIFSIGLPLLVAGALAVLAADAVGGELSARFTFPTALACGVTAIAAVVLLVKAVGS